MKKGEIKKLIKSYQECRPYKNRHLAMLVEANKHLVYKIAGFYKDIDNFDDLVQEGFIGLVKGLNTFKPTSKGEKMAVSTHLWYHIDGYIRKYLQKNNPYEVTKTDEKVEFTHLVKNSKKCKKIEVRHFQKVKYAPKMIFVEGVTYDNDGEEKDSLLDKCADQNEVDEVLEEKRQLLREFSSKLSSRERKVYEARFIEEKTLQDTGNELGITRERVRQIEVKIIRKLKAKKAMHDIKKGRK